MPDTQFKRHHSTWSKEEISLFNRAFSQLLTMYLKPNFDNSITLVPEKQASCDIGTFIEIALDINPEMQKMLFDKQMKKELTDVPK